MPAISVQEAFELAFRHHQAGRLAEAETLYQGLLAIQPDHGDSLHLLGVIALQTGRTKLGFDLIRRAAAVNPGSVEVLSNLGEAYRVNAQLSDAARTLRRALEIDPKFLPAWMNLGHGLRDQGNLHEAAACYRRVLALRPDFAEAYGDLGGVLTEQGYVDEALDVLREGIRRKPHDAKMRNNFGNALLNHGQIGDAIEEFKKAVELKPEGAKPVSNLGSALVKAGRSKEAIAILVRGTELHPNQPEIYFNLGIAWDAAGDPDKAMAAYHRTLDLQPNHVGAANNLGTLLKGRNELDNAIAVYERARESNPESAETHYNLGIVYHLKGRSKEAVTAYRRTLELKPDHAQAQNNLGNALIDLGQVAEAMGAYKRALDLDPTSAVAKFNYSTLLLLQGDFERGWPMYEARWSQADKPERTYRQPRWGGEDLKGRRVLIYAEQGLGDSIQFVRYASLLAARGGEVIVECPGSLVELFRRANDVHDVTAKGERLPPFDVHLPMLSQPLVFQTRTQSIPSTTPYLFADEGGCEIWRERLKRTGSRTRVGLAWAGSPENRRNEFRSISLPTLLPLLDEENVEFQSLQLGQAAAETEHLPSSAAIIDFTKQIQDFADTAALMMNLDLIISVDTAVAHLAGALGRPVWTLLPFVPDWRWGLEGETTPWYPTMRLFRQPALGDWESVVRRVADELKQLVAAKP